MARYRTRYVCPVRVATFAMDGYFQRMIWFREYPCVLTISLTFFDQMRLQTCEPVSMQLSAVLFTAFQNECSDPPFPLPTQGVHVD